MTVAIKPFIDKPVIKAITRVRRSGKSTFLKQIISIMENNNEATTDNIIYINKKLILFDTSYKGIKWINLKDFLLKETFL